MMDRPLIWINSLTSAPEFRCGPSWFRLRKFAIALCALFVVGLGGCKDEVVVDKTSENPHFSHLAGIAEIYVLFRGQNGGSTPDEASLKTFGDQKGSYTLQRLGVESVADLLVSNRDGAPVKLLLKKGKLRFNGSRIIAHETMGKDGKRMVALESGGAELLTDEEFNAAGK